MSLADQLSDAESKFFETGELPPELAAEQTPPQTVADLPGLTPSPATPDTVAAPLAEVAPPPPAVQPDLLNLLQRQLADSEARRLASENQFSELMAQIQAAQTQADVPDPQADPFGHMQHQITQIATTLQNLQANQTQQSQTDLQNATLQQFVTQVRNMRDTFAQTTPDFKDAYAHVRDMRMQDMRDAGVSEANLPAAVLQDEMSLAQAALASGRNPAQVIYDMAKRHGYSPKSLAAVPAADKLAQLVAGQAAARNVPRSGTETIIAPEALRDASETDLDKLIQSDDLWHKVVGGGVNKGIF